MHNVYYVVDECHEARKKLRFLSEFLSEFYLNHPQELLLLCFIGFARYRLRFLVNEIKSAQEMPQTTKAVRDPVCCLKCVP